MKTLAIIPARGGSKGVHRKNIIELHGKPLIAWSIKQAINSKVVDYVHISTDDEEIAHLSIMHGASCEFLRPKELSGDPIGTDEAILNSIEKLSYMGLDFEVVIELQPTYCFRGSGLISNCINKLYAEWNTTDSVVTCEKIIDTSHPDYVLSLDKNEYVKLGKKRPDKFARQNLELYLACKGVVLATKVKNFKLEKTFFSNKCKTLVIQDRLRTIDINDNLDLDIARFIAHVNPWLLD